MIGIWIVRALAAVCVLSAAVAVGAFVIGAPAVFSHASATTLIALILASSLGVNQLLKLSGMIDALRQMQRESLARFGYAHVDETPMPLPPLCGTCEQPVTGYTGRYTQDRFGSVRLSETNDPCGCLVGEARFLGRATEALR